MRGGGQGAVRTATEVAPRKTPPSRKRAKMRFLAKSATIGAVSVTKKAKVAVSSLARVRVTMAAGLVVPLQSPVDGTVSHTATVAVTA